MGVLVTCFSNIDFFVSRKPADNEKKVKKVQVGKDQEKAQSEKKIPTPKTEVGKNQTNNQVLIP